jgi:hypothetical protein
MNALIVSSHPVTWLGLSAILSNFGSVNTVEMCSKDDFIKVSKKNLTNSIEELMYYLDL